MIQITETAARTINHEPSEIAAVNERGVLQKFGTRLDCYSAVAVHCESSGAIHAFVAGIRASGNTVDSVYQQLIAYGAEKLFAEKLL